MSIYLVMKNGKRIELEKKKRVSEEKWISNCIEFVKENEITVIRAEKEDGTIIYQN